MLCEQWQKQISNSSEGRNSGFWLQNAQMRQLKQLMCSSHFVFFLNDEAAVATELKLAVTQTPQLCLFPLQSAVWRDFWGDDENGLLLFKSFFRFLLEPQLFLRPVFYPRLHHCGPWRSCLSVCLWCWDGWEWLAPSTLRRSESVVISHSVVWLVSVAPHRVSFSEGLGVRRPSNGVDGGVGWWWSAAGGASGPPEGWGPRGGSLASSWRGRWWRVGKGWSTARRTRYSGCSCRCRWRSGCSETWTRKRGG